MNGEDPPPQSPCWLPESVSKWCIKFSEERKRKMWDLLSLTSTSKGRVFCLPCEGKDRREIASFSWTLSPVSLSLLPQYSGVLWEVLGGGKMLNPSCLLIFVWVSLCSPGWPETWDPPASVSLVLTLQACLVVWTGFWRWGKIETDGRVEVSFYLRMSSSSLGGQVFSCGGFGSS